RVPYFVHRTTLAKQLPVYPKYRYKGTQVSTIVRRIEGDGKALAKEIQAAHPDWTVYYNRNSNFIEVRGLHVAPLRDLLTAKGF
ncbi:ribosomal protein L49/IMG2, partial [Catenaria anguillulae PL171]